MVLLFLLTMPGALFEFCMIQTNTFIGKNVVSRNFRLIYMVWTN